MTEYVEGILGNLSAAVPGAPGDIADMPTHFFIRATDLMLQLQVRPNGVAELPEAVRVAHLGYTLWQSIDTAGLSGVPGLRARAAEYGIEIPAGVADVDLAEGSVFASAAAHEEDGPEEQARLMVKAACAISLGAE